MRRGWFYESARHSLARRGIPTGRGYFLGKGNFEREIAGVNVKAAQAHGISKAELQAMGVPVLYASQERKLERRARFNRALQRARAVPGFSVAEAMRQEDVGLGVAPEPFVQNVAMGEVGNIALSSIGAQQEAGKTWEPSGPEERATTTPESFEGPVPGAPVKFVEPEEIVSSGKVTPGVPPELPTLQEESL